MRILFLFMFFWAMAACSSSQELPPCMEERGITSCHDLFDAIQADPANMELIDCYEEHCR
ncbi:hypothetical protein [Chitinivibrio alkaliphilus]|uniref:Lipoprotein n=1 Tax=Chitinivibrio alkaliphilus ACht1 TaxID=1313304 RepID=U7DBE1_9BACT|nr:hypothetical protein [Chitinivibrio alkaliphilus]ERP38878.1 hypothetical protein CALK_0656 [Chitinivibrio alkaliphilus ACht1]